MNLVATPRFVKDGGDQTQSADQSTVSYRANQNPEREPRALNRIVFNRSSLIYDPLCLL